MANEVDKELAAALKLAKTKRMYFALVMKGGAQGTLIVQKMKIPPGKIDAAKKELGGAAVVRGTCMGEDGALVFETAKPPAPAVAKLIKKIAKEEAGLTINPVARVAQKPDEDDDETDADESEEQASTKPPTAPPPPNEVKAKVPTPPPPPDQAKSKPPTAPPPPDETKAKPDAKPPTAPPPPVGDAAKITTRLKEIKPGADQVIAAGVGVSGEVKLRLSETAMFVRKQDFAAADRLLGQIEGLVRVGLKELEAKFTARLKGLMPEVAKVGGDAKVLASEAGTFARKKEFAQASEVLDRLEALLAGGGAGGSAQDEWNERVSDVEPAYLEALKTSPDASKMRVIMNFAVEQAEAGNYDKALAALKRLDPFLAALPRVEAELETDEDEAEGDGPDPAAALANYQAARAKVMAQLSRLAAAIKASGHGQADAALIEIKAVQANLTAKPDTLKAAQELERYLETDDVVADVDGPNPFGIEVDLQETMLPAVYDLTASL